MCEIFVKADPSLYESKARSLRLHGVVTSIRLETLFWNTLQEIAQRDGMTTNQLVTKLYDELSVHRGHIDNFASFLRVCCPLCQDRCRVNEFTSTVLGAE